MVSYLGEASKATRVLLRDGNRESHFYHTAGFNFWFASFSLTVNEKEYHLTTFHFQDRVLRSIIETLATFYSIMKIAFLKHNRNTGNILQYNEK